MFRRWQRKARYLIARARERRRERLQARETTLSLTQIQRRLDLLLTAMYGRSIPIASVKRYAPNRLERLVGVQPREATPAVDNQTIHLPSALPTNGGVDAALARYRLLAVEQAERLARGTVAHMPLEDALIRDLYLVREGSAVDARIARAMPGLAGLLANERSAALAHRPHMDSLSPHAREVELLLRSALSETLTSDVTHSGGPEDSLAWATEQAEVIRRQPGLYRGIPPATLWGTIKHARVLDTDDVLPEESPPVLQKLTTSSPATDFWRERRRGQTEESGSWNDLDDPQALHESQRESIIFGDETLHIADDEDDETQGPPSGTSYDEWDSDRSTYIRGGAIVHEYPPTMGDESWASDVLHSHASLVRQVRHQFERLRARRTLLGRQRAGDDIDLAACVKAVVDRRRGEPPDDRLYVDARPARRGLALSLLVDASGSTEAGVTTNLQIIDLEKIAVLLASQALDALGDLYAVYAFAGKSATNVKVTTLKDFSEHSGKVVNARVAGLQPGGFTRMGAAVRHATHRLARQTAGHRLLLILSDGRPNDVDRYQGSYGVEDSRQAIMEARASGVYPFCLTVDSSASEYLPRIFGKTGHTIIQRTEQLPTALVSVVRTLIRTH